MSDNEIIKALSNMFYAGHGCMICKHRVDSGEERCGIKGCNIARNALDLINQQKAEIERLKEAYAVYEETTGLKWARAEAIKEFAEKLKRHYVGYDRYDDIYAHHIIDDIDFLVEEMLGYNPNSEHQCGYKPIAELKNKCGTCVYAVPSTFGKGYCYVECTNQEHIAKYCKRPISRIRQRTAPACRSYEDKTEKGGDNDA